MSLLSKDVFDPLAAFFANVIKAAEANGQSAPALGQARSSVQSAATSLHEAEQALAAAIPAAATVGVNYVLSLIPGGTAFEPIADSFLAAVIAQLEARKPVARTP